MAVAVIALTIISIFAVGMAVIVFQPALYNLTYQNEFWDSGVDPDLLIARETLYSSTIAIPVIALGAVSLWAYLSISRRDDL